MGTPKSHTQFALGLYNVLLTQDMVRQYGNSSIFARDYEEIKSRVKNEGFSFFSKTLPTFAKAIDKALVVGALTSPRGFKKAKGCAYPVFLSVMLERVFEQDGSVKIDPCISAVRDLRQILYLLYKYELPFKEEVIDDFINDFKSTDIRLGWNLVDYMQDSHLTAIGMATLGVARTLLRALLQDTTSQDEVPKHGSGAVATGEKNWEKMTFRTHYECIHQAFPYYKFFCSNAMDLACTVRQYWDRPRVPSGIAKVVLVPKDSRGPRLISEEPLEFMWVQQMIKKKLYRHIESHVLTRGHINFTDQTVNADFALQGSVSGSCVTLDMKEASDRISLWLVRELFAELPILKEMEATRTEATELPSGEIHLLRKFAPMGSALCFPIMSLVHWSLAVATLNVCNGISMKKARAAVFVYGDDIVINGENHQPLIDLFPVFGLKFNTDKCCTTGIFRESCGMDAVLGQSVAPLKIKKPLPGSPYDADQYISYLAYVNRLWQDAYYSSSLHVGHYLEEIFGTIPHVPVNSSVPGYFSERGIPISNAHRFLKRWNKQLQRKEWKVNVPSGKKHYTAMDRSEYHRKLVTYSDEFVAGVYSVPHRIKLKKRWSDDLI